MTEKELMKYYDLLLDMGVSEQTLVFITNINGLSYETLCDVLYQLTGYRNFDQLEEEE